MNRILNSHRSVIFLDGRFPNAQILRQVNTDCILIAADGAYDKMMEIDITAHFIVGDLDSQKNKDLNIHKIKISDKNTTDFEKCILFVKENNLFPCLVLGVNGGEIDHILGNMQVILKYSKYGQIYFLDTYLKRSGQKKVEKIKIGIPLSDRLFINLKHTSLISLISFDEGVVCSKGLKWELKKKRLDINDVLALRNHNVKKSIELEISEGKAIVIFDINLNYLN